MNNNQSLAQTSKHKLMLLILLVIAAIPNSCSATLFLKNLIGIQPTVAELLDPSYPQFKSQQQRIQKQRNIEAEIVKQANKLKPLYENQNNKDKKKETIIKEILRLEKIRLATLIKGYKGDKDPEYNLAYCRLNKHYAISTYGTKFPWLAKAIVETTYNTLQEQSERKGFMHLLSYSLFVGLGTISRKRQKERVMLEKKFSWQNQIAIIIFYYEYLYTIYEGEKFDGLEKWKNDVEKSPYISERDTQQDQVKAFGEILKDGKSSKYLRYADELKKSKDEEKRKKAENIKNEAKKMQEEIKKGQEQLKGEISIKINKLKDAQNKTAAVEEIVTLEKARWVLLINQMHGQYDGNNRQHFNDTYGTVDLVEIINTVYKSLDELLQPNFIKELTSSPSPLTAAKTIEVQKAQFVVFEGMFWESKLALIMSYYINLNPKHQQIVNLKKWITEIEQKTQAPKKETSFPWSYAPLFAGCVISVLFLYKKFFNKQATPEKQSPTPAKHIKADEKNSLAPIPSPTHNDSKTVWGLIIFLFSALIVMAYIFFRRNNKR